jgi:hypothetical protein
MVRYPEMFYGWCLLRTIHFMVCLRATYPNERILITKYDYSDAYRRISHAARTAAQSILILAGIAFLALRLAFGGSPNPACFCAFSEALTNLANELSCSSFEPKEFEGLVVDQAHLIPKEYPTAREPFAVGIAPGTSGRGSRVTNGPKGLFHRQHHRGLLGYRQEPPPRGPLRAPGRPCLEQAPRRRRNRTSTAEVFMHPDQAGLGEDPMQAHDHPRVTFLHKKVGRQPAQRQVPCVDPRPLGDTADREDDCGRAGLHDRPAQPCVLPCTVEPPLPQRPSPTGGEEPTDEKPVPPPVRDRDGGHRAVREVLASSPPRNLDEPASLCRPTKIAWSNSCPFGIGGYTQKGFGWRVRIPADSILFRDDSVNNVLEFLGMAVSVKLLENCSLACSLWETTPRP